MDWNDLSMAEKAEIMEIAVKGGVYNLDAIRNGYNEYAKGGKIHIKPSKKGTFTAAASKHGMGVQQFASRVLAHPENYSPAMRKKANFARNAAKWKHEDGGELDVYNEPQTFAGRVAEAAGASPSIVRGADVASSIAQITPWGHYIAAADLGRDLNRVYHKEEGAKKDVLLDLISMLPGISAPELKAAENAWNTIRGNSKIRRALNTGIITGRVADFVDDTYGADKTSKAFGGVLGNYYLGLGDVANFLKKGWNKVRDAVQASAVYENPAIMMAAGQRVNKQGKVEYNHDNDEEVKQLRSNLATLGEGALSATTATGDVEAAYNIVRHPIQTAKAIREGAKAAYRGVRKAVGNSHTTKNPTVFNAFETNPIGTNSQIDNASLLSEKTNKAISKYANSSRNPVEQVHERMRDSEYSKGIRSNAEQELLPKDDIVYFEGIDYDNPDTYKEAAQNTLEWWNNYDPSFNSSLTADRIIYRIANQQLKSPITTPPAPYVYIPKKDIMLNSPEIRRALTEAGENHQYNILKAHDTAHYYSVPNNKSPLADMFSETDYLGISNNAELAARGSQLKNYFNKKSISEDELKYAAENYVKDTGVDNDMTRFFNAVRQKAKTNPNIWKEMSEWITRVSPAAAIPIALTNK